MRGLAPVRRLRNSKSGRFYYWIGAKPVPRFSSFYAFYHGYSTPCLLYCGRNCTPVKVTVAYITHGASTGSRCHRRDAQSRLLERILKERVRICNTIRRSQGRVQYDTGLTSPFLPNDPRPSRINYIRFFYTERVFLLDGLCWLLG